MPRRVLSVASCLVAAAAVLVPTGPASATTTEDRYAAAVLTTLNAERAAHHLPALHSNAALRLSARRHNLTMAAHDKLAHQLPGEASLGTRLTRAGYSWHAAAENIGATSSMSQAGALAIEQAMYNERPPNDPHRVNILSRAYADVGVSIYLDTRHHLLWFTTDFGHH